MSFKFNYLENVNALKLASVRSQEVKLNVELPYRGHILFMTLLIILIGVMPFLLVGLL
jgi:hypothetical protein